MLTVFISVGVIVITRQRSKIMTIHIYIHVMHTRQELHVQWNLSIYCGHTQDPIKSPGFPLFMGGFAAAWDCGQCSALLMQKVISTG